VLAIVSLVITADLMRVVEPYASKPLYGTNRGLLEEIRGLVCSQDDVVYCGREVREILREPVS